MGRRFTEMPDDAIYTVKEYANFHWRAGTVKEFIKLWIDGTRDIATLAEHFNRPDYEIADLIVDLAERQYISRDGCGAWHRPLREWSNEERIQGKRLLYPEEL